MKPSVSPRSTAGTPRTRWLFGNAGRDRCDDVGRHLEGVVAVFDPVASLDPFEIRVDDPNLALVVLGHEEANGPIEPGVRIGCEELDAKRRVAKDGTKISDIRRPNKK